MDEIGEHAAAEADAILEQQMKHREQQLNNRGAAAGASEASESDCSKELIFPHCILMTSFAKGVKGKHEK